MADNRLPLLMAAAAGLGALLWWDTQSGPMAPETARPAGVSRRLDSPEPPAIEGRAPDGGTGNPLARLDKVELRDMTERPLFHPSRRPPPAAAPRETEAASVAPTPPPSAPDYTLLGIIRDGDRAIALLRSRSDGRALRMQAGDMIGGWEIASVETVSVRLKRGDGTAHELRVTPR